MGIDPVTHTPCLDIQQLSSILNSSLYNSPHVINPTSHHFGMANNNMLNPNLLSLLTAFLSSSSSSQNPAVAPHQNFQQNYQTLPLQENHTCAAPSQPSLPHESQLMKPKLDQMISPDATSFCFQSSIPNVGQYEGGHHHNHNINNYSTSLLDNHQIAQNNTRGDPNFTNLGSLISYSTTPSSSTSPSTLNSSTSSTTFVKGVTEEERDTYCSNNMFMYNISNALNNIDASCLL